MVYIIDKYVLYENLFFNTTFKLKIQIEIIIANCIYSGGQNCGHLWKSLYVSKFICLWKILHFTKCKLEYIMFNSF